MDHPRPFDEPEQIVEEGTPLPRMTGTGDEKVMNDTIGIGSVLNSVYLSRTMGVSNTVTH